MAKKNNNYFELIVKQSSYCVEASNLLEEILCKFNSESVGAYRKQMHEIENAADEIHHDILNRLSAEFITPIDQEDILHLVQIIDDITDALDEVILDIYMYHIDSMPEMISALSKEVKQCVNALYDSITELKNFKKPDTLRSKLVSVNDIEACADEIYIEAMHKLFAAQEDTKVLFGAKAIYESLENCCDLCEHAADVIEQVIIKNT